MQTPALALRCLLLGAVVSASCPGQSLQRAPPSAEPEACNEAEESALLLTAVRAQGRPFDLLGVLEGMGRAASAGAARQAARWHSRSDGSPPPGVARGSRAECPSGLSVTFSNMNLVGVVFSYSLSNIAGGSCSSVADFGPASCCFQWGASALLNMYFAGPRHADLTLHITMRVSTRLPWSWTDIGSADAQCPICGVICNLGSISLAGVPFNLGALEMPACSSSEDFKLEVKDVALALPRGFSLGAALRVVLDSSVKDSNAAVIFQGSMEYTMS